MARMKKARGRGGSVLRVDWRLRKLPSGGPSEGARYGQGANETVQAAYNSRYSVRNEVMNEVLGQLTMEDDTPEPRVRGNAASSSQGGSQLNLFVPSQSLTTASLTPRRRQATIRAVKPSFPSTLSHVGFAKALIR